MKQFKLVATAIALSMTLGTAAFAQSGQIGPAKSPNGSMPAAPSNSTPQSGSQSGSPISGSGVQNDNGGQAFPSDRVRAERLP